MANGLAKRITNTINELQGDNNVPAHVVNALILEVLEHNTGQIEDIKKGIVAHTEVHREIEKQHTKRQGDRDNQLSKLTERLAKLEKIIYYPARHPGQFSGIVFAILVVLSAWFLSGTRLLILEAVNAPDWLINFLNPATNGLPYPYP